jgi:hypothetical protein
LIGELGCAKRQSERCPKQRCQRDVVQDGMQRGRLDDVVDQFEAAADDCDPVRWMAVRDELLDGSLGFGKRRVARHYALGPARRSIFH